MRIKTRIQAGLTLAGVTVALAGCGRDNGHQHAHDHEHPHPEEERQFVAFDEKKGLFVSTETARWLDLQTAEVETRNINAEWRFGAQIFRQAQTRSAGSIPAAASAWMKAEDARRLKIGQAVRLLGPTNGIGAEAKIAGIDALKTNSSGSAEVIIELNAGSSPLLAGAPVFVCATLPPKESVAVPASALVENVDGWFVYVVDGEHFRRVSVEVEGRRDGHAQISRGLKTGDRIVTKGATSLWLSELKFTKAGAACCPVENK